MIEPGNSALDDPAFWQDHKSSRRLWQERRRRVVLADQDLIPTVPAAECLTNGRNKASQGPMT
jgi:hypothetical protein